MRGNKHQMLEEILRTTRTKPSFLIASVLLLLLLPLLLLSISLSGVLFLLHLSICWQGIVHLEMDVCDASNELQLQTQKRTAQRRVLVITLVVLGMISVGSFACVAFGVSEVINHDKTLMNDGLGEVMTVLGICFALPCVFCIVAFMALTFGLRCWRAFSPSTSHVILWLTVLSFVLQQVLADVTLFSFLGAGATASVVADVCVFGCYIGWASHGLYVPVSASVVLFFGKMAALWCATYRTGWGNSRGSAGVLAALFLSIPVVQLPLFITVPRGPRATDGLLPPQVSILGSFSNKFNLLLLHLLNTLDVITLYTSLVTPLLEVTKFAPTPAPFRCFLIAILGVAFVGNNIAVIHLFYVRDGVECAELRCLPRTLRDATDQWSADDVDGSHKRRILQYMLLLLVVCDVPLLGVRLQLWWGGHQMLSVFVIKNVKSILDTVIVMHRVERSNEHTEGDQYLLSNGF